MSSQSNSYSYESSAWNDDLRTSYGANGTLLIIVLVLSVFLVFLFMILIKYFQKLFTIERSPLRAPGPELKAPAGPITSVWSTLWRPSQSIDPSRYYPGVHSMSTRAAADSELESIYADTLPMTKMARH